MSAPERMEAGASTPDNPLLTNASSGSRFDELLMF